MPAVIIVRLSVWLTALLTIVVEAGRGACVAHVLAHAVEDDDGVVDRVAGDRQQAGDDVERQVVAEERQERQATSRSCSVAAIAPTAKLNWNRSAM